MPTYHSSDWEFSTCTNGIEDFYQNMLSKDCNIFKLGNGLRIRNGVWTIFDVKFPVISRQLNEVLRKLDTYTECTDGYCIF